MVMSAVPYFQNGRLPHGAVDESLNTGKRQLEGINGTFQSFQKVDAHQSADTLLTSGLREVFALVVCHFSIFLYLAWEDIVGRCVDAQTQQHQLGIYFIVVNGTFQIGKARTPGDRRQPFRELADFCGVIIFFNVLSGSGDGYAVQNFKEVKIKGAEQCIGGAFFCGKFAPGVEHLLSLLENILDGLLGIQLGIDIFGIALIGNGKLIFKVYKTVVNRGSGEHQHLGFYTGADNPVHQFHIAVLHGVAVRTDTVTEVMALIYDNQVIVSPIQTVEVKTVDVP